MEKKHSQFVRQDDFNPGIKCDNPIQEKWIHKQIVKKTGETEDDFIIDEKPVLIDSVDLHKSIQEEAKTTDLKYLLKQLLMTGDESVINKKPGFYGDVSMFGGDPTLNQLKIDLESIKKSLPEEMRKLSDEEIAKITEEDIIAYYQSKIKEVSEQKDKKEIKEPVKEPVKGQEKGANE